MIKATAAFNLFLRSIIYKHKYFRKKGKLGIDGSFYYDDKRLAQESSVSLKTIMRAKRFWVQQGIIKVESGKFRTIASKYWIIKMPDNMSPFDKFTLPDKMSIKDDKLSIKAPQDVTPNNDINKETKHLFLPSYYFAEVYKEKNKDRVLTKNFLLDLGFTEFQLEEAFTNYEKSNAY